MFLFFTLFNIIFNASLDINTLISDTMFNLVDKSKISKDDMKLCQRIIKNLARILNENVILKNQKQGLLKNIKLIKWSEFDMHLDKQHYLEESNEKIEKYKRKQQKCKEIAKTFNVTSCITQTETTKPASINFMRMFYEDKCKECEVKIAKEYEKRLGQLTNYDDFFRKSAEERTQHIDHKKEIYRKAASNYVRKEELIYRLVNIFFKYKTIKKCDFEAMCMIKIDEIQRRLLSK